MKIDSAFIEYWEPKYECTESDQPEYEAIITSVGKELQNLRTIRLDTFRRIVNWKSARSRGLIKWDQFNRYQRAFSEIMNMEHDKRFEILNAFSGIGPPMASVVLHFMFPETYPIYDIRTVETLNYFGYFRSKTVSKGRYAEFCGALKEIKDNVGNYTLREIDRALFSFHKQELGKVLKVTSKNSKPKISKKSIKNGIAISRHSGQHHTSIPEIVRSICEELGRNGKIILRKDILEKALEYNLNLQSVLPADYCSNTKTGRWTKHSFLFSVAPGKYRLAKPSEDDKK